MVKLCMPKYVTNKEKCLCKPLAHLHSAWYDPYKQYFAAKSCAANTHCRKWEQWTVHVKNSQYESKVLIFWQKHLQHTIKKQTRLAVVSWRYYQTNSTISCDTNLFKCNQNINFLLQKYCNNHRPPKKSYCPREMSQKMIFPASWKPKKEM